MPIQPQPEIATAADLRALQGKTLVVWMARSAGPSSFEFPTAGEVCFDSNGSVTVYDNEDRSPLGVFAAGAWAAVTLEPAGGEPAGKPRKIRLDFP